LFVTFHTNIFLVKFTNVTNMMSMHVISCTRKQYSLTSISNDKAHVVTYPSIALIPETAGIPTWLELAGALESARTVAAGLVRFLAQHGGMARKAGEGSMGMNAGSRYKVSMCRDLVTRGVCPRTINCTFAHSEEELER
jgi:hypothetical protein